MILAGSVLKRVRARTPRPKAKPGDHRCREWRIFHGRTPVDFDPTQPPPDVVRRDERQNEVEYRLFKPRMEKWRQKHEHAMDLQALLGR